MSIKPPELPCERVKLPMICVCPPRDDDKPNERRRQANALREKAQVILSSEKHLCTDANFVSFAVGYLSNFGAELEVAVDQWFGAYATVKKYVDCEHWDLTVTGDSTMEEIEAATAKCPGEPECFVYEFVPILKVTVECDRLEDGIAQLVVWFKENRDKEDDQ